MFGLFSSDSKSTTSNTNEETTTTNVDNRVSDGDNGIFEGNTSFTAKGNIDNVTVTKTDYGALDSAEAIVNASLSALSDGFTAVNETAQNAVESAKDTAGDALDIASEATRDEGARTLQFGLGLAGIVGIAFIFSHLCI